jgi:hypothetical protein
MIRLTFSHVIEAQEVGQDGDDLRLSPGGWARFRAFAAQAELKSPVIAMASVLLTCEEFTFVLT